jgi:hypothetical protein
VLIPPIYTTFKLLLTPTIYALTFIIVPNPYGLLRQESSRDRCMIHLLEVAGVIHEQDE